MELITTSAGMKAWAASLEAAGRSSALVPTMGALHEGHLSLVRLARTLRPDVVVSIFVNPTQFGPGEDFERYPRDLAGDRRLVEAAGATAVFAPTPADMYPEGFQTTIEVRELSRHLCGPHRPGHFRGVATVVAKLLTIVQPEVAVFGEKDWQQLQLVRRLVRDLDLGVEIVGHPTVREPDGLAMSSRNAYLSPAERRDALSLWKALRAGRAAIEGGERDADAVRRLMRGIIEAIPGAAIDYAAVSHPETLVDLARIDGPALLALAVRIGTTRLIDNLLVPG